jgi:uncharacterized Zn-finger protein
MTDEVIPHFRNDLGVQFVEIGAKKFMCMGALPPQDHPHVFCDMGEDAEYVCPYCSTPYWHNPAMAPNRARRRNVNFTTFSDDELFRDAVYAVCSRQQWSANGLRQSLLSPAIPQN